MEVSFSSSRANYHQGNSITRVVGRDSKFGEGDNLVSRSVVNVWDRTERDSVVVSLDVLDAGDFLTGGSQFLDVTARLVNGHDRIIPSAVCDTVREMPGAEDRRAPPPVATTAPKRTM